MKTKLLLLALVSANCAFAQTTTTNPATEVAPAATMVLRPPEFLDPKKQEWFGDLRLRQVLLKDQGADMRPYTQLRARLGFRTDVNDDVKAVFRLMTESSAISGNQRLGDSAAPGMPRRSFGLDWGYMDWKFSETGHAYAGRTMNPLWAPNKAQIIYDADLSFEGFAAKWEPKIMSGSENLGKSNLFVNAGAFMISENFDSTAKKDTPDSALIAADVGVAVKASDWTWTTHVGHHSYVGVKNRAVTAISTSNSKGDGSGTSARINGNTADSTTSGTPAVTTYRYANEFVLLEAGTEWKQTAGPIEYTLFFDYVKNTKVDNFGTAIEGGAGLKWKFLTVGYALVSKERDSVIGAFTDSDTNGGGTDNKGSRINLGFQLAKNATFTLIHHMAKRGVDTSSKDFSSTFGDLLVSF